MSEEGDVCPLDLGHIYVLDMGTELASFQSACTDLTTSPPEDWPTEKKANVVSDLVNAAEVVRSQATRMRNQLEQLNQWRSVAVCGACADIWSASYA